jgi:hypothetical protein
MTVSLCIDRDAETWTVLGQVEVVEAPAMGPQLVSRVVPSGPRGLWDALVRATGPAAPVELVEPLEFDDLALDPSLNQAHLAFLAAI